MLMTRELFIYCLSNVCLHVLLCVRGNMMQFFALLVDTNATSFLAAPKRGKAIRREWRERLTGPLIGAR